MVGVAEGGGGTVTPGGGGVDVSPGSGVGVRVGRRRGEGKGGRVYVAVGSTGVTVAKISVGRYGTNGVLVGVAVRVPAARVPSAITVGPAVLLSKRISGSPLTSKSAEIATYAPRQMIPSTPMKARAYARLSMRR